MHTKQNVGKRHSGTGSERVVAMADILPPKWTTFVRWWRVQHQKGVSCDA